MFPSNLCLNTQNVSTKKTHTHTQNVNNISFSFVHFPSLAHLQFYPTYQTASTYCLKESTKFNPQMKLCLIKINTVYRKRRNDLELGDGSSVILVCHKSNDLHKKKITFCGWYFNLFLVITTTDNAFERHISFFLVHFLIGMCGGSGTVKLEAYYIQLLQCHDAAIIISI